LLKYFFEKNITAGPRAWLDAHLRGCGHLALGLPGLGVPPGARAI